MWCHHETITVSLLLALLLATLYFYLDSLKLSSKGLLAFVAVVNPLTVQLVAANRIVIMEKICLLIYFAWGERTCSRPQNNLQSSSNQVLRLTDSSEPPL